MSPDAPPGGWEARLKSGERLIWQGRPDATFQPGGGVYLEPWRKYLLIALLGGLSLMLVLTVGPTLWGHPLYLLLLLVFVGLMLAALAYFLGGKPYVDVFWRRRSYFALTDRRALFGTHVLGRLWVSKHKLRKGNTANWDGRTPGDVIFHEFSAQGKYGQNHYRIGFERIENGGYVRDLVQQTIDALDSPGDRP